MSKCGKVGVENYYFPGRPKAAGTALGVGQLVGRGEGRLPDRGNAELGHALAGLDGVGFVGQIHHRHAEFAAVVAVNDADAVCHAQAALDGQAAAA